VYACTRRWDALAIAPATGIVFQLCASRTSHSKLNDSENDALTTPLSVAGTAEDLDTELPSALVQFVGAHLELKNTLESAKEQMAAAAKTAKAEARLKTSTKIATAEAAATVTKKPAEIAPKPAEPKNRSRHAARASLTLITYNKKEK
jgi:PRTRC genetic system protein E